MVSFYQMFYCLMQRRARVCWLVCRLHSDHQFTTESLKMLLLLLLLLQCSYFALAELLSTLRTA